MNPVFKVAKIKRLIAVILDLILVYFGRNFVFYIVGLGRPILGLFVSHNLLV